MTPGNTMYLEKKYLTADQIKNIHPRHLPLAVLSDNPRSFFSFAIKAHEEGQYNHFMWMHRPGFVVSQGWTLKEERIEDYLKAHRLKFWSSPSWTVMDRASMIAKLYAMVNEKWYRRLYDPLQIVGKWLGLDWLQIPGNMRICSDHGDLFSVRDPEYPKGAHLSPPEINRWLQKQGHFYKVFGRYAPD